MKEIWKAIPGYESIYEASSLGNIRALDRLLTHKKSNHCNVYSRKWRGRILTKDSYKKYFTVCLSRLGKQRTWQIHQLVAKTFTGEQPKGYDTNHKDGNRFNNSSDNLEYITRKQNIDHAVRNGLHLYGEKIGGSKLKEYQIISIRAESKEGLSQNVLAKKYGVDQSLIWRIIHRKSWKHVL